MHVYIWGSDSIFVWFRLGVICEACLQSEVPELHRGSNIAECDAYEDRKIGSACVVLRVVRGRALLGSWVAH